MLLQIDLIYTITIDYHLLGFYINIRVMNDLGRLSAMKKITIIGSGFAALTAVRRLRKKDKNCEITVISPSSDFIYAPSLIWVPTGLRTGDDLRISLTLFFKRLNVKHIATTVSTIEKKGRTVITDAGPVENDGLIIASGGRFIKKLPGIEHALTICEGVESAKEIKRRIDIMENGCIAIGFGGNPKELQAVRGGPMFEILFGLDTYLRRQNKRDKIGLKFFCPAQKPGIRLGEHAFKGIMKEMQKRDIEVACLGAKLKAFEQNKVVTETTEFPADLILFMPGMTGPAWLENTELPQSDGGMIKANKFAKVEGFDRVYVAGDSGSFPAPDWAPKQAHMADLQAVVAADNLLAELRGLPAKKSFRWELICIVDTLDKGILVFRNAHFRFVLPAFFFHTVKRLFEWNYLRQYRH